jgi:hypothetical protein
MEVVVIVVTTSMMPQAERRMGRPVDVEVSDHHRTPGYPVWG